MSDLFESISHPIASAVNERDYWMTKQILPINQRLLVVDIASAIAGNQPKTVSGIENTYALEIENESDVIRLRFTDPVTYSVTDEKFATHPDEEVSDGRWLRIFSVSFFLDFVKLSTWATSDYPGRLIHYQINTLDNTINIVTANPPEILELDT